MRVSTKGQVTIPITIRTKLGILPDTDVQFVVQDDGVLIKKQQNRDLRGTKLITRLSSKSTVKMSTDTIMKLN